MPPWGSARLGVSSQGPARALRLPKFRRRAVVGGPPPPTVGPPSGRATWLLPAPPLPPPPAGPVGRLGEAGWCSEGVVSPEGARGRPGPPAPLMLPPVRVGGERGGSGEGRWSRRCRVGSPSPTPARARGAPVVSKRARWSPPPIGGGKLSAASPSFAPLSRRLAPVPGERGSWRSGPRLPPGASSRRPRPRGGRARAVASPPVVPSVVGRSRVSLPSFPARGLPAPAAARGTPRRPSADASALRWGGLSGKSRSPAPRFAEGPVPPACVPRARPRFQAGLPARVPRLDRSLPGRVSPLALAVRVRRRRARPSRDGAPALWSRDLRSDVATR